MIAMGDMSGSVTLTANESVTVVATGSGVTGLMQVAVTVTDGAGAGAGAGASAAVDWAVAARAGPAGWRRRHCIGGVRARQAHRS